MDNKNLYTNTAKFYDKGNEINKYDHDIKFYEAYVNESTTVLEIACGTGRVTVPLASKCKRIIGMDLSQSMLKELNNKISRLDDNYKNNIKTSQADMTDFNMDEKFDLIIFAGMAFLSLTNNEERIK
ncbi:class I SAM-dependent methyltransferase [Clostridium sp. FP1]|uniref:class I SAM-dependent methyltransferase n=1 Tax=Clostridium sp. FP1 TaxID=2724076 RepID=UPI0013E97A32|nr:class I SAM-dependent methyltransferase [Clostridium sp. FP1]MBZ9633431.1 class I SAM-dependent methyltransferase [Clostridium sp. FP1]